MVWQPSSKIRRDWKVLPHPHADHAICSTFSWEQAQRELDGRPDKRGLTTRLANALRCLGVGKSDRGHVLAGRIPGRYLTALGTLKNRSVFCPLLSASALDPIRARMTIGQARVLVTTETFYERRVAGIRTSSPHLDHAQMVGNDGRRATFPGTQDSRRLIEKASLKFAINPTDPDDMACLYFTGRIRGTLKGAVNVPQAAVAHHITGKFALARRQYDAFWCTADPGWVTGTPSGIIAPLTNGVTSVVDEDDFAAERWYCRVSVCYTAPTAIRMTMKAGADLIRNYDLTSLHHLASIGESFNLAASVWGQQAFRQPFHDNWRQTKTDGIIITSLASEDIRPGSMGRPLPGIETTIICRTDMDDVDAIEEPDAQSKLSLQPGWSSMFRSFWREPDRYKKCFASGWYPTGDLAKRDGDGYLRFVGQTGDVIEASGHLVGPFEVESVLREHKAMAEAGITGKPDSVAVEVVQASLSLKDRFEPSDALRLEPLGFARTQLGAVVAPKEIAFLPRPAEAPQRGNIHRRLRAKKRGLRREHINVGGGTEQTNQIPPKTRANR